MADTLLSQIQHDRIRAMKSGNEKAVGTLRMLESALGNEAIAQRTTALTDEVALGIVGREIKKRRDAIVLYEQGNRPDLAQKEREEIAVLEPYLPAQLSPEALQEVVARVVAARGEKSMSGKLIGAVLQEVRGTADAASVRAALEKLFAESAA